ncbi:MAG TPA: sigma-70 family RNA polymerase sigma factor [Myxococcaceae bacterium]|nr:sigma-70 family RNA polymerase sigma factor [Myxococcaceae bacterium]
MAVIPDAASLEVDDVESVARCKAGDRAAFRQLYEQHFRSVHRTALCLGTPPGELEDVGQEVFSHAFRRLDQFTGGNFGHWLHRICANVVTDHHRRRRVRDTFRQIWGRNTDVEEARGPSPEGASVRAQAQEQVAQILARMRPKQREVFALFELEALSGEEIADRVGCPVNTVWTRLHHARKAFVRIGRKRGFIDEEALP